MPVEEPQIGTVAWSTAAGLFGGGVLAVSRPMTRREVYFCMLGGVGIGAFLSPAIQTYWGLPPYVASCLSFMGGLSVFVIVPWLQALTGKVTTKVSNDIASEPKKEAQQ